jgi:hypothetical protein
MSRRTISLAIAALFVAAYIFGLRAIWSNDWALGLGDCTVRAVSALTDKLELPMLWSDVGLRSPWPKGHTLFIGGIIQSLCHGADTFSAIHWYQTLSWTAYVSGIVLFTLSAAEIFGGGSALAALAVFLGFGAALTEAANGMTEVFVFLLSGLATWCLIKSLKSPGHVYLLYVAGVCNLAASTMRTEIIIVAFIQWLLLVGKTGAFRVIAFGFLSSGFFLARLVFSTVIDHGQITFLNSNRMLFASDAAAKGEIMARYFWNNAGLAVCLAGGYLVLLAVSHPWRAPKSAGVTRRGGLEAVSVFHFLSRANSLELFPVRCLGILALFMVEGLRSGSLEANERYWIALMPYLALTTAAVFSLRPTTLCLPIATLRVAMICTLFVAGINTVHARWQTRNVFQAGELDFIHWLEDRKDAFGVFDTMNYRDGRYILYSCTVGASPHFWGRGVSNPLDLRVKRLKSSNPVENRRFRTEGLAHATLSDPWTKLLILPSPSFFKDVKRIQEKSDKRTDTVSYFRKDLEVLPGDKISFRSFLSPNAAPIHFGKVYANDYVEVFQKL